LFSLPGRKHDEQVDSISQAGAHWWRRRDVTASPLALTRGYRLILRGGKPAFAGSRDGMVGGEGIEPSAPSKYAMCSATELTAHNIFTVKHAPPLANGPEEGCLIRSSTMRMILANLARGPKKNCKAVNTLARSCALQGCASYRCYGPWLRRGGTVIPDPIGSILEFSKCRTPIRAFLEFRSAVSFAATPVSLGQNHPSIVFQDIRRDWPGKAAPAERSHTILGFLAKVAYRN
jgi:hypothetical protein